MFLKRTISIFSIMILDFFFLKLIFINICVPEGALLNSETLHTYSRGFGGCCRGTGNTIKCLRAPWAVTMHVFSPPHHFDALSQGSNQLPVNRQYLIKIIDCCLIQHTWFLCWLLFPFPWPLRTFKDHLMKFEILEGRKIIVGVYCQWCSSG